MFFSFSLLKLGVVLVVPAVGTSVAVPLVLTAKRNELIQFQPENIYEELCREVNQDLTDLETDKKIKLLACPDEDNPNRTIFYLYDLKNLPKETEEVEKFSPPSEDFQVTFTFVNKTTKTFRAHSSAWKTFSEIELKKSCEVKWSEKGRNGSKLMICTSDKPPRKEEKWLIVVNKSQFDVNRED